MIQFENIVLRSTLKVIQYFDCLIETIKKYNQHTNLFFGGQTCHTKPTSQMGKSSHIVFLK